MSNFDRIAWIYDLIKYVVFGNTLETAEMGFVNDIKDEDYILIVGGGTGNVLNTIPSNCGIDYVELSEKMLEKARKRKSDLSISFYKADYLSFEPTTKYDVIICSFFLDVFNDDNLRLVLQKLSKELKSDSGILLVTDFNKQHDKPFLSWLMHLFFKVFANLESSNLKDITEVVESCGFQLKDTKLFKGGYIFSKKYSRHGNL
ncbi:MAG: class I SAM-dependent methyltransferase [bacterium]|nr:class I SAM-dependent methyltransferase [bacterium]